MAHFIFHMYYYKTSLQKKPSESIFQHPMIPVRSHPPSSGRWAMRAKQSRFCVMLVAALLSTLSAVVAAINFDVLIAESHAAAALNRAKLLDRWTWDPHPALVPCPAGPSDVCHARNCIHCGCVAHAPPCPPPPSPPLPPQIYANCPNQVQCTAMPTAIATLFTNTNATAVAGANAWVEANFANTSSDWWRNVNGSSYSFPLENSYSVAMFAMFNSRSRWVKTGQVASLTVAAEKGLKAFWLKYVEDCARFSPGEAEHNPLSLHDSENIDAVRHTGCFLGSATLALFPDTVNRTLPDNTTVHEAAVAWEEFSWKWLKSQALHGFFDELGSSDYWTRIWPCVFDLHSLSEPGSRVHALKCTSIWRCSKQSWPRSVACVRGRRAETRRVGLAPRCATAARASSTRASLARPAR
jgi:hypothetical protein